MTSFRLAGQTSSIQGGCERPDGLQGACDLRSGWLGANYDTARLRPAAAVLQRATAGPWPASVSRRRPPLWGR
jgi:hypothetical protein